MGVSYHGSTAWRCHRRRRIQQRLSWSHSASQCQKVRLLCRRLYPRLITRQSPFFACARMLPSFLSMRMSIMGISLLLAYPELCIQGMQASTPSLMFLFSACACPFVMMCCCLYLCQSVFFSRRSCLRPPYIVNLLHSGLFGYSNHLSGTFTVLLRPFLDTNGCTPCR